MPAPAIPVVESRTGYLYDGTNSADLAAAIDDFTVGVETPTELNFTSGGQSLTVVRGGYVVSAHGMVVQDDIFANEDDFRDTYADMTERLNHTHDLVLTTGPGKPADAEGDE